MQKLINSIPNMTQLTQLIVPYIADDALLSRIGHHCPQLELLDISGVSGVTDEGVKNLYRMTVGGELWPTGLVETLRYLMIGGPGGTRLSSNTVATMLIKIPHIVSLGSYPYTGEAVYKVSN